MPGSGTEFLLVFVRVGQRTTRQTLGGCGSRHRGGHCPEHPGIERLGDQVVGPESQPIDLIGLQHRLRHRLPGEFCQRPGGGEFHAFADAGSPDVERSSEDEWKPQNVVDLVGKIAAAGRHQRIGASRAGGVIGDLGIGVGQGKDQRRPGHRLDHPLGHGTANGHPHKGVGIDQSIGQGAGVGIASEFLLDLVQVVAARSEQPRGCRPSGCSLASHRGD